MEIKVSLIECLIKRAEVYSRTSIEIMKLKFVDKIADVFSKLISRLIFVAILGFFILILNIGIALWLGEIMGKNYLGFLAVASFYGLVLIIFPLFQPMYNRKIKNAIVSLILN
jgi:hypothetical protein